MSEGPQHFTIKEYVIIVAPFLSVVLLMALVFYSVQTTVDNRPNLFVTIGATVVVGGVLFCLALLGNDLFRRGSYAARALRSMRKGSAADRLHGIEDLHSTGKQSAFYIKSVQQGEVGGTVGAFILWEEKLLLDKYVLPGLNAAIHDVNTSVRYHAIQALEDIGTGEALTLVNELKAGSE